MTSTQSYEKLLTDVREIGLLDSISALMGWDEQTYLPPKGTDLRAEQSALIAKLSHSRLIAPAITELLQVVESSDLVSDPESDAGANIRQIRRIHDRARKLPTTLVEEMTRTTVKAQAAWVQAKTKSHFPTFEPWLDKVVNLKREEARCIGFKTNPYDALLDAYEPGESSEGVENLFKSFRPRLVDLIGRIAGSSRKAPVEILERKYPVDIQERLSRDAAKLIGFDFSAGRLDIAVHPFCSGQGPGDTRMTTRYDPNYFGDAFFSVLHETGHCLYEQGLPKEKYMGLPLSEAISLGIHESQSRMWENLVGRSRSFWKFFYPQTQSAFGDVLKGVGFDDWLFAINDVRTSLIRTEADQATYNLHVMLRFDLEQAMLKGDLNAADIPAAWNARMKSDLGLVPPDDARGCLQDVHWSHGLIGYFPTYTLGNLYAAQFFDQARKDLGDLDAMFAKGDFMPLLGWLREKIHRHGKRYTARKLVQRVTGSDLSPEPLMKHLEKIGREYYGV